MNKPWRQMVPNKEGYWLRTNVVGKIVLHYIRRVSGGEMALYDGLYIMWGWDLKDLVAVNSIKSKLKKFYWLKIPDPPAEGGTQKAPDLTPFEGTKNDSSI